MGILCNANVTICHNVNVTIFCQYQITKAHIIIQSSHTFKETGGYLFFNEYIFHYKSLYNYINIYITVSVAYNYTQVILLFSVTEL